MDYSFSNLNQFTAPTHQMTPPVAAANKTWLVREAQTTRMEQYDGTTNSHGTEWKEKVGAS